jgi:hypothetical protein
MWNSIFHPGPSLDRGHPVGVDVVGEPDVEVGVEGCGNLFPEEHW